jgi:MoxR-like ATPase
MEFNEFIKQHLGEAKTLDMNSEDESGKTPGEMLRKMHDLFGTDTWKPTADKKIRAEFPEDGHPMRGVLLKLKMIARENGKTGDYKITELGLEWLSKNNKDSGTEQDSDLAVGVKDISKLIEKKFLVPKMSSSSKYVDQMKTILSHMKAFAEGTVKTTYMLGGDPGTGKTSFIRSLSTLTGIPLVVIEAPHITQEHLINIPFLVIDGPKTRQGNLTVDDSVQQMKVVQAESNLVTQLKSKTKRTPDQIKTEINKNKILRDIYPILQKRIEKVAESYNAILFLDEFYRTASIKIRNVLRNILNGKIGNDKIPKGVYIIMATNINDEGVEDIPLNQDFHLMDYDVSSKEDFMSYMYGKYVNNPEDKNEIPKDDGTYEVGTPTGISIKPEVWNKFMNELTDKELGFNDESANVRLSPRRLEQMLICIDSLIPVNSEDSDRELLGFIKNNLSNYVDEKSSIPLLDKFTKIATDLIKETTPEGVQINIENILRTPVKKSQWRDQLKTELELKIKLGDSRKYVPVVSGQPGIGKTTQMVKLSEDMKMGYIHIDVSNLTPEDITGMPIADMSKGQDNITTNFSESNLYITIMKEYNEQINDYRQEGRKYNIILLFDELNRASVPVFNSIRKILLEKEFEHVKLPDDIIITGAINPNDIGAIEFTTHTRDVLDIIPSSGNFTETFNYIKTKENLTKLSERMGFDLTESVSNIMYQLALEFKSAKDSDGNDIEDIDIQPFWWSDGVDSFYVSPREMTECISNTMTQIEDSFDDMGWDLNGSYSDEEYKKFIDEAINVTAKSFVTTFKMITLKQEIEGFTNTLGKKIVGNEKFKKSFETIRTKKSVNTLSLVQILKNADGDVTFLDKGVIGSYIKDFSSTEMLQDVATIVDEYFNSTSGAEILDKTLKLYDQIAKSLEKLNASNNYADQLKKAIGSRIVALLSSNKIDILDVLQNEETMKKLKSF